MLAPLLQISRLRALAALCLLSVASLAPVQATSMRALTVDDLAGHADAVVRGRVLEVRVEWNSGGTMPVTVVDLEVQELLDGSLPPVRRITVTQPGGTRDGVSLDYAGRPRFTPGQETVLFLAARSGRQFTTVGLAQGKFDLGRADAAGRRILRRNLAEIELSGEARVPADLQELRGSLRARLSRGDASRPR